MATAWHFTFGKSEYDTCTPSSWAKYDNLFTASSTIGAAGDALGGNGFPSSTFDKTLGGGLSAPVLNPELEALDS